MNLNYTIFVDLFSLCKKILSIKPLYRFFRCLVYNAIQPITKNIYFFYLYTKSEERPVT